jgi:hypothetical protein
MAGQKRPSSTNEKKPRVRIVRPSGRRPFQQRYFCPVEKREVRVSTGDRDEDEAERRKKELEAKLLLGLDTKSGKVKVTGPEMDWADFREQYRTLHLATVRESTATDAESRLDIAERILRPKTLADVANSTSLQQLQARLLAGEQSLRGVPRSPRLRRCRRRCCLRGVFKRVLVFRCVFRLVTIFKTPVW